MFRYFTILFVFLFSTLIFSQNTYYVDQENGLSEEEGADGINIPWRDFSCFDINDLPPGSTVIVAPGVYTQGHENYDNAIIDINNTYDITIMADNTSQGIVLFDGNINHVELQYCDDDESIVTNYRSYLRYGCVFATCGNKIHGIQFINFYQKSSPGYMYFRHSR